MCCGMVVIVVSKTTRRQLNGTAVRTIREALGIRSGDLAYRAGVTPGTLSHIERDGRQVSVAIQRGLADALGVPLEAITFPTFTSEEEPAA